MRRGSRGCRKGENVKGGGVQGCRRDKGRGYKGGGAG